MLSPRLPKYLKLAIKVALANDSYPRKRHGAVLVKGGSVQTVGWNSRKNEGSRHAEVHAIQSAEPHQLHGATLYVARVGMDTVPRISAPCADCRNAVLDTGIRQVIYTVSETDYGLWRT